MCTNTRGEIITGTDVIPLDPSPLPTTMCSSQSCLRFVRHSIVSHCRGFIKGSSRFSFQQNNHILQQGHPRRDPESHL